MSSRTLALLLLCLMFSGSESRPRPMYEVGCSKTRYVVLIYNRSLFKYFHSSVSLELYVQWCVKRGGVFSGVVCIVWYTIAIYSSQLHLRYIYKPFSRA